MSNVHRIPKDQIGMSNSCYYHKICKEGKFRCTNNSTIMNCVHVRNNKFRVLGFKEIIRK